MQSRPVSFVGVVLMSSAEAPLVNRPNRASPITLGAREELIEFSLRSLCALWRESVFCRRVFRAEQVERLGVFGDGRETRQQLEEAVVACVVVDA